MKPEKTYQELKELAEKLSITVKEQSFRTTGVKAKSGHCIVRGEQFFIMDSRKKLKEKIEILATFMKEVPLEDVYVVPAIRDLIDKI